MPLANTRLLTRMRRTKGRLQTMRIPTIDSWQQSHTVCCVTPLVNYLLANLDPDEEAPGVDMQPIYEALTTATECQVCAGDGSGEIDDDGNEQDCKGECSDGRTGTVYEYWVVDTYLGEQLRLQGEALFGADCIGIVGDLVWCRTTSGQLIAADSCVEAAYAIHCDALKGLGR